MYSWTSLIKIREFDRRLRYPEHPSHPRRSDEIVRCSGAPRFKNAGHWTSRKAQQKILRRAVQQYLLGCIVDITWMTRVTYYRFAEIKLKRRMMRGGYRSRSIQAVLRDVQRVLKPGPVLGHRSDGIIYDEA